MMEEPRDVDDDEIQVAAGSSTFTTLSVCLDIDSTVEEGRSVTGPIVLQAGATNGEFTVNFLSDGHYLEFHYRYPSVLTNFEKLLKFRLRAEGIQKSRSTTSCLQVSVISFNCIKTGRKTQSPLFFVFV